MSGLGCWKVHWTFRTAIYIYRTFLLYIPDFVISRGTTRHDQLCYQIFFMKMTHNLAAGFACGSPDPDAWFPMRQRILIPERSERHWTTRPNYDGIYEPLRCAPKKISNLDIYLLRPRALQTGPRNVGLLCRERLFSSMPRRRGERSSLKFLDRRRNFSSLFMLGEFQRVSRSGRGHSGEQHPFYVNVLCCFWISRGRLLPLVAERLKGGADGYASSWKIIEDKTPYGFI